MYIFTIKNGKANLVTQCDEYDQIISQDTFPARMRKADERLQRFNRAQV